MRITRTKSMSKAILTFFGTFMIALVVSIIIFTIQIAGQVNEQVTQNTASMLHMIRVNLIDILEKAEDYITDLSLIDPNFQNLGSKEDMSRTYAMGEKIDHYANPILDSNSYLSCIFVYSKTTEISHDVYGILAGKNGAERLKLKKGIKREILELLQKDNINLKDWFVMPVDKKNFFCRITRWQSVYMICCIDLEQMADSIEAQYDLPGKIIISKEGKALIPIPDKRLKNYQWTGVAGSYKIVKGMQPLLIVEESIGSIHVACIIPIMDFRRHMSTMQMLLMLLLAVLLLTFIAGYYYLRRHLVAPMNEIVKVMGRIGAGDMGARASEDYRGSEFQMLSTSFNSMISSIKELQIEVYEKQLENEKVQLTALKLQIRPHFYLNCLKSIYALAAIGRNKEVQDKVLYLSNHLRYVFTEMEDAVSLQQELNLCRNYVGLINADINERIEYREDINPELRKFQIPPVTLLTLVENSLKHGETGYSSSKLEIFISAHILPSEEGRLINIVVKDNGTGFSEDTLTQMEYLGQEHVGLNNFQRRMLLFYKNNCSIAFSNNKGAQVDIFILSSKENIDETSDRR